MTGFTPRQNEIINASIELIAEKGIQQFTIKNLSAKIGTVEGAIYRHFESKRDILLGILTLFENQKIELFQRLKTEDQNNPFEKLKIFFEQSFSHFASNPALAAVVFSEEIFQNDQRLSDKVYKILLESQDICSGIIESCQKNGLIRPDISNNQAAVILIGALRLTVTKWRLSKFSFDLQAEGRQLWKEIEKILSG